MVCSRYIIVKTMYKGDDKYMMMMIIIIIIIIIIIKLKYLTRTQEQQIG